MQKDPDVEDPKSGDLYQVGVLATVEKVAHGEKGEINALVKGKEKVKIINFTREEGWFEAKIEIIKDNISSIINLCLNLNPKKLLVFQKNIFLKSSIKPKIPNDKKVKIIINISDEADG